MLRLGSLLYPLFRFDCRIHFPATKPLPKCQSAPVNQEISFSPSTAASFLDWQEHGQTYHAEFSGLSLEMAANWLDTWPSLPRDLWRRDRP